MYHPGWDDGQVVVVALGAVIESGVVAEPSLHRLRGWGEGTVAQGTAEVLVGEPTLGTHSQLIVPLFL